jgi:hypothetical protein
MNAVLLRVRSRSVHPVPGLGRDPTIGEAIASPSALYMGIPIGDPKTFFVEVMGRAG